MSCDGKALWNVKCYTIAAVVKIETDSFKIIFSGLRHTVKFAQIKKLLSHGAAIAALMCTLMP